MRCPSCTDLSVAESNATTAIAVRHQIESMVAAGRSERRHRPGARVRVRPDHPAGPARRGRRPAHLDHPHRRSAPARWWAWASSSGAGAATSARCEDGRGRGMSGRRIADGGGSRTRSPGDERWYLTDERDFLQRSLDDADREHEAGDLSGDDHAVLVARDAARLAEVEAELAALDAALRARGRGAPSRPEPAQPSPRCRCGAGIGIVAVVPSHRRRRRHPGRALRPGPSARPGLVGQRHGVAGPAHRAAAAAGLTLNKQGQHQGRARALQQGAHRGPVEPCGAGLRGLPPVERRSDRARERRWCGSGAPRSRRRSRTRRPTTRATCSTASSSRTRTTTTRPPFAQFNDFLADGPPAAELPQAAPLVAAPTRRRGCRSRAASRDRVHRADQRRQPRSAAQVGDDPGEGVGERGAVRRRSSTTRH